VGAVYLLPKTSWLEMIEMTLRFSTEKVFE
jgi:hypothetical protein